ncbi:hypothetical protein HYV70_05535 [Candidatus Uhrbacteria bacterium]|nr:hypothetical protein [Candidatus Uhrbacteria bacterium]
MIFKKNIFILSVFLLGCLTTFFIFSMISPKNTSSQKTLPHGNLIQTEQEISLYGGEKEFYVVDSDHVLAVVGEVLTEDTVKIARISSQYIDIITGIHALRLNSGAMYRISRETGAVSYVKRDGTFWATSPDNVSFAFSDLSLDNETQKLSVNIDLYNIGRYEDPTILNPDVTIPLPLQASHTGTVYVSDLAYSPDGRVIAVVAYDESQSAQDPEYLHGTLFAIDPITQTVKEQKALTMKIPSDPSPDFSFRNSISGWDSPSTVHLKLPDGQEMSVDLAK